MKLFPTLTASLFFILCASVVAQQPGKSVEELEAELETIHQQLQSAYQESNTAEANRISLIGKAGVAEAQPAPVADSGKSSDFSEELSDAIEVSSLDTLTQTIRDLHLNVRYSAFDSNSISKPASIQFTVPDDGEDSYAVDVGLTWNITQLTGNTIDFGEGTAGIMDIALLGEYHRNNKVTSEKNSFQTGALITSHLGDVTEDPWVHYFDVKATYKNDRINTGKGAIAELMYWPLIARPEGTPYEFPNIGGFWGPEWLVMKTQPGIGIQFENADDIDSTGMEGDTFRAKASAELAVYPFANLLDRNPNHEIGPLELVAGYHYWSNWNESGGFALRDDSHSLFKLSINYYFGLWDESLGRRPFGIGMDYVDGENPEEGFDDDKFWQFGFRFIF